MSVILGLIFLAVAIAFGELRSNKLVKVIDEKPLSIMLVPYGI